MAPQRCQGVMGLRDCDIEPWPPKYCPTLCAAMVSSRVGKTYLMPSAIPCARYLARTAQFKLWAEVTRPNPELRLLVGHSNLIELLMLELQHADFGQPQETPYRWTPEVGEGNGGRSRFVEDMEDYQDPQTENTDSELSSDSDYSSESDSSDDLNDAEYDTEIADEISQRMAPSDQAISPCLTETGGGEAGPHTEMLGNSRLRRGAAKEGGELGDLPTSTTVTYNGVGDFMLMQVAKAVEINQEDPRSVGSA
ncbi:hypothetical protein B0I37DRAFT_371815 [Chaetomium sp. MPI-CAGE-AT-0009]|nr:hypothetical protein B0I37DRAFT_371815 [Chaetomium sp. MPI-CAGE-AT-0009]